MGGERDLSNLKTVLATLPKTIINGKGNVFKLNIEVNIKDVTANTFFVTYKSVVRDEEAVRDVFYFDEDPQCRIEALKDRVQRNGFLIFKENQQLSIE